MQLHRKAAAINENTALNFIVAKQGQPHDLPIEGDEKSGRGFWDTGRRGMF
jgi:hypothetical protein